GYGEVDLLVLDSLSRGEPLVVLDLFCQRAQTVDEIDRSFPHGGPPFFFDHHQSTLDRYGNRPWVFADRESCAARVYYRWLMDNAAREDRLRLDPLEGIVEVANDRDLWLNRIPESRLWQALVTLCGPWAVLARLIEDPSPELSPEERSFSSAFVE
ncbi:MAG TPA: phosphohydrolase, partial [Synergistaceae bacterium]|nr:phosphohydrolase [Synergistaceae bacterium]